MSYYDELKSKLDELYDSGNYKELNELVEDELKQAYIPRDIQEKLSFYKDKLHEHKYVPILDDDNLEEYLNGSKEQQLLAVDYLNGKNLRDYIEICNKYLCSKGFINAKVLLVDSLIRQEITEDIKMSDEDGEYTFIPKYLMPVEESFGYDAAIKYLNEYYLKEPSKLKMAKDLVYKQMIMMLPINTEEEEGLMIAKKISEYIDGVFAE